MHWILGSPRLLMHLHDQVEFGQMQLKRYSCQVNYKIIPYHRLKLSLAKLLIVKI